MKPFEQAHLPIVFLDSPQTDKDALARRLAAEKCIRRGPVCALSALEPSPTFEQRGTHIIRRVRPCHVRYPYQIHPVLGGRHARIQTWFPFHIQIGMNGREWLARQMQRAGLKYRQPGNGFVWIEDSAQAQKLMQEQLKTPWAEVLNGFAQQLNPIRESLFERYPTEYYGTVFQSEWATDGVFPEADFWKR